DASDTSEDTPLATFPSHFVSQRFRDTSALGFLSSGNEAVPIVAKSRRPQYSRQNSRPARVSSASSSSYCHSTMSAYCITSLAPSPVSDPYLRAVSFTKLVSVARSPHNEGKRKIR